MRTAPCGLSRVFQEPWHIGRHYTAPHCNTLQHTATHCNTHACSAARTERSVPRVVSISCPDRVPCRFSVAVRDVGSRRGTHIYQSDAGLHDISACISLCAAAAQVWILEHTNVLYAMTWQRTFWEILFRKKGCMMFLVRFVYAQPQHRYKFWKTVSSHCIFITLVLVHWW